MNVRNGLVALAFAAVAALGGCGPDFEEKWTIDTIPDDSQIAQVMDNIQKKAIECNDDYLTLYSKCDKKSYISSAASLALYALNKKGIDETPLCIGYGTNDDGVRRGSYVYADDCIWINRLEGMTVPIYLLRTLFHEMGHKKHYELNGSKNENVSNFFRYYFEAFSHTLFVPSEYPVFNDILYNPTDNKPASQDLASQYLFPGALCKTWRFPNERKVNQDFYKKYDDATYLQYKEFCLNNGDFDKTLEVLADYGASEDFEDDIEVGQACDIIKCGVDTYEKFVLDATNGGYKWISPQDNKEHNLSEHFYTIDLCR